MVILFASSQRLNGMRIKQIVSQQLGQFQAVCECEFCGNTQEVTGVDTGHFHNGVIPNIECNQCHMTSNDSINTKGEFLND